MLSSMEKLDPASDEFAPQLSKLRDDVLEHAEAEEDNIFPLLRASSTRTSEPARSALREGEGERADASLAQRPDTPPGNTILGPIAAFADKVRDATKGL
jgi:hypothetical protein